MAQEKKLFGLSVPPDGAGLVHAALNGGIDVGGVHFSFSFLLGVAGTLHYATKANDLEEDIETTHKMSRVVKNSSRGVMDRIRRNNQITPPKPREGKFVVQSIVLRKSQFEDYEDASDWLDEKGFVNMGVVDKPKAWYFKQRERNLFESGSLRSKRISPRFSLLGGRLK